ncbi:glycosyltransferase [Sphingomicrobium arenosum]|uniref:glycosyltransferase n=1 Tax=Sphingomicrobium arenosum TaxID=2233861 RepID=UPI00223FFFB7|nr:glycosyltransferase [Sphingomicrobium arenosum]
MKPIGYFVHHQGRGHLNRAAAISAELVKSRPVTLFSARFDDAVPLAPAVETVILPSLFEPQGDEAPAMADLATPANLHCAPVGWPGITRAIATLSQWFEQRSPALFITDVSAELAQFARIASVPHVCVLQHGDRCDEGHASAYDGAVGLLAPYHEALDQPDRKRWAEKTRFFPGVGVSPLTLARDNARRSLGIDPEQRVAVVLGGGGGEGLPATPLTLAARAHPNMQWITLGKVRHEWHETAPGNLRHLGWVDNVPEWLAAADLIVSSAGNSTVHQVLALGRPWIVVPEWRYFAEQHRKCEALARAQVAIAPSDWPADAASWKAAVAAAFELDVSRQQSLFDPGAATAAARWIDRTARDLWAETPQTEVRAS